MELIKEFLLDFSGGIFKVLLQMTIIITIIMVILEVLRALGVIDFLNKILYKITRVLGISEGASLPLFIGFFIGITYGAASIIESYQRKDMNRKDVILVSTFLCLCHAIIEDTILFASLGANVFIIAVVRIVVATLVTILVRLFIEHKEKKNIRDKLEVENQEEI